MANLNVQNLSQIVQSGDVEKLFTGSIEFPGGGGASEARLQQVMQEEGMSTGANQGGAAQGKGFADVLKTSMDQVNVHQHEADKAIKELVAGRSKNIHETMLTIERADASLKLMMQVRNKILEAYREVMRMQV